MTKSQGTDAGMREDTRALVDDLLEEHQKLTWEERNDSQKDHDTTRFDRAYAAVLALSPPTGSAGEDETGVREALADGLPQDYLNWRNRRDPSLTVPPTTVEAFKAGQAAVLAPQPPKAETPAGVGETGRRAYAAYASSVETHEGHPDRQPSLGPWSGIKPDVRRHWAAVEAALAPAARDGDGVGAE